MTTDKDIWPCAYCGNKKPTLVEYVQLKDDRQIFQMKCEICWASGGECDSKEECIRVWNSTRCDYPEYGYDNKGNICMDEIQQLRVQKDEACKQRNRLAAMLARLFPSYLKTTDDTDWPVIYITLPTGQISFHIPEEEVMQFMPLHKNPVIEFDGHTDEEKWRRTLHFILNYSENK